MAAWSLPLRAGLRAVRSFVVAVASPASGDLSARPPRGAARARDRAPGETEADDRHAEGQGACDEDLSPADESLRELPRSQRRSSSVMKRLKESAT